MEVGLMALNPLFSFSHLVLYEMRWCPLKILAPRKSLGLKQIPLNDRKCEIPKPVVWPIKLSMRAAVGGYSALIRKGHSSLWNE